MDGIFYRASLQSQSSPLKNYIILGSHFQLLSSSKYHNYFKDIFSNITMHCNVQRIQNYMCDLFVRPLLCCLDKYKLLGPAVGDGEQPRLPLVMM